MVHKRIHKRPDIDRPGDQDRHPFFPSPHLTTEQVAWYADTMSNRSTRPIPEAILMHVAECPRCRAEVFRQWDLNAEADRLPR